MLSSVFSCLKPDETLALVFEILRNTDANFLNLHIDKATKTRGDKQLFNHTLYETNFKPKLFTANVECNGTVIKLPKTEKPILFLNFKLSLNGGDLLFWFTLNLAVDFRSRPKMALTLEILSDQMHFLVFETPMKHSHSFLKYYLHYTATGTTFLRKSFLQY